MDSHIKHALTAQLLAMADDEILLAHRDSEWTGHAPILEEDIALANLAQDELGHASVWYGLLHELTGEDANQLVFFRDASAYCNIQMVELPNGDWAFTLMRQYLFDVAEMMRLTALMESDYRPLADAAAKVRREELYHVRHSSAWIRRLGLGTEESHRRTQKALNTLWPFALQMFVPLPNEAALVANSILPDSAQLQARWLDVVLPFLHQAGLEVPETLTPIATSRQQHSKYLAPLLQEMQEVARQDPGAEW
ncbi:MAG: phenylacetate-CoA oxygenase subunit PaaC [Ardenticatenaceae bacterium]|nr:phenylacetate-CoA oxygenase subunit PaaC [Ardenticatenaceae bacterium]